MSDASAFSRIVPDVDQSLSSQHLRQRPPKPRLWPLWLMIVTLTAATVALAGGAWLERERLLGELERVSGEVSNLHARLAADDSDVQDKIALVQAQVRTLFQEQEQLSMRFNATRDELLTLIPASDDRVSADAIEALLTQVKKQQEAAGLRDDQLTALSESLAALERSAESEHRRLSERMETLFADAGTFRQRLDTLENEVRQLRQSQLALSAQLEMLR
ncbi:hypothetical protein GCM10022228_19060 [Halomonas cibimaris]|uniref:ATPase n=1 Tax=Halomonas cibimaris TaxID=657012 RepID=A0ABP7LYS5_9GAMM